MPTPPDSVFDFKAAVARQFAGRPTLRKVVGDQLLAQLKVRHPVLTDVEPVLTAEALELLIPHPSQPHCDRKPLIDAVLQAWLDGKSLDLEPINGRAFALTLASPFLFPGADDAFGVIQLVAGTDGFDALIAQLDEDWCQAQIDYWQAIGSAGVSRDRWLQLLLKTALLSNLPLQGLDAQQQACVHGLLGGGTASPSVFVVEVQLDLRGQQTREMQTMLLVTGEWDERQVVLWCSPSSVVRAFDSLDEFAEALRDTLAERFQYDAFTWHRQELEGDIFAQQTALLLDNMLTRASGVRHYHLGNVAELEQVFDALSAPEQWFIDGYFVGQDEPAKPLPGLLKAKAADSFAYQDAVFELALEQAICEGSTAPDEILDLHSYTRQKLREALLADYPLEANYQPDDLILELKLSQGVPGGAATGAGGGEPWVRLADKTLTEFAIGNLSSLGDAVITGIRHKNDQLIMPWLTGAYLRELVQRVDIGGKYPAYVAQAMNEPVKRPQRVERFAREWRQTMIFSALDARLERRLSDAGLQVVTDYCRGFYSAGPAASLIPLAFTTATQSERYDLVSGMYLLYCAEPSVVLLYRPLYKSEALREFASLDKLKAYIAQSESLQASILQWMSAEARAFYHSDLSADTRLVHVGGDPLLLPESAQLALRLWSIDVDTKLYNANRDLLVAIAEQDVTSNAESRWALLERGAWLLFQTVTPLLRGPVAVVAWLAQGVAAVRDDVSALSEGSEFERSAAVVDLILNVGMTLMHARLPGPQLASPPSAVALEWGARPLPSGSQQQVVPAQGKVGLPGSLTGIQLDFSWRGNQGFNWITPSQRESLKALRSGQDLSARTPVVSGSTKGLYQIEDRLYAQMGAEVYRVELITDQVRIVGPQGSIGPWLSLENGAWRIDRSLRLLGGGPKTRREILQRQNRQKLEELMDLEKNLTLKNNALSEEFRKHREFLLDSTKKLEAARSSGSEQVKLLESLNHQAKLRVLADLKSVIRNALEHDEVLTKIIPLSSYGLSLEDALKQQRSSSRQELISNCESYYNELASLINAADINTLAESLVVLPELEGEKQHYRDFYTKLQQVVEWERDLEKILVDFDRLLECTLKDDEIVFTDAVTGKSMSKTKELNGLIERRRLSATDLAFRQLTDLAEASLDRLAEVDERVLVEYEAYLNGPELQSAGAAHADLAGGVFSTVERIEILKGVVDAYEQALAMSEYLRSFGGKAIRAASLQDYRRVLKGLKARAEAAFEELVREQELAEQPRPRVSLYPARGGKRRVVRTQRGRSVVGLQREVDGRSVIEQLDYRKAVLKTFREKDGKWVEDVTVTPEDLVTPVASGALTKQAQALIGDIESVIKLARQYIKSDQPISLSTIIDGHKEKLEEVLGRLPRLDSTKQVIEALSDGITRLETSHDECLTELYLSSHRPTAESLRFLWKRRLVTISRVPERKRISVEDYLDIYEIRRPPATGRTQGICVWEAHFHYTSESAAAREFVKGHLKLWRERKLGRKAQLRAATQRKELLSIYRGDLRLEQVDGIIPFD